MPSQDLLDQIHKLESFIDVWETQGTLSPRLEEESNIHQKTDTMDHLPGQKICIDDIEKSDQEESLKDISESKKLKEDDASVKEHMFIKDTLTKEDTVIKQDAMVEKDTMFKENIIPKEEENCITEEEEIAAERDFKAKESIVSKNENNMTKEEKLVFEDTLPVKDPVSVENMGLVEITVPVEDLVPEDTEKKEKNMVSLERQSKEDDIKPSEENQSKEDDIFEKESIISMDEDDTVSEKESVSIKEYTLIKDNKTEKTTRFERNTIKEATITKEKTPDEKMAHENVLEEDAFDEELSKENSAQETSSEKIRLMEINKEALKNNDTANMVQPITLRYYKPDEKVVDSEKTTANHTTIPKEYKPENNPASQKIQRKAVLNDYKTAKKRNEKSKVEPSISLLSLATHFSNMSTKNLRLSPLQRTSKSTSLKSPTQRKNEKNGIDSMLQRVLSTRSSIDEHSRENSISSKTSLRSVKSFREEKTLQKYIARSYEEMMRIPNVLERVSFYEKTLDICLKEESPITKWCDFVMTRGKPDALEEGYTPMPRSDSLSDWSSCSSPRPTFGKSISQFFKKTTASLWNTASESKPASSLSRSGSTYGSGLFERSMSLLGLSRADKANKFDKNKTFGPRVNAVNTKLSFSRSNSIRVIHSTFVKSSTSQTIGKDPLKDISKEQLKELNYMATILPHEDIRGLLDALNEANGDTMNAISIALDKNKSVRSHASNFD